MKANSYKHNVPRHDTMWHDFFSPTIKSYRSVDSLFYEAHKATLILVMCRSDNIRDTSVKPLHRIIATSLETCRRLHRKMRLHWKSHSGLQSTSLLGYFTGKKPLHWKHEGSKPLYVIGRLIFDMYIHISSHGEQNVTMTFNVSGQGHSAKALKIKISHKMLVLWNCI